MNIYVIRHGETEWNKEEVFRGRKDIPLNDNGRRQAEHAGAYFTGRSINRIVSSPLARARQTAEAIGKATDRMVETMEEFTDINFGIWEGLSLKEVGEKYPQELTIWRQSPQTLSVDGAESLVRVKERISEGLRGLYSEETGSTIVIVTHRVICKLIVLHLLEIGNEHFWDMKYDPASVTLLEKGTGRAVLIFSNDTCHLNDDRAYRDF